jgi:hypothetical protein
MKYTQDFLLFYRQKIESAQKPSGHVNKPITVPLGGSGKMYGIVSVPEHCIRCKYAQIYNRVYEGKSCVRYIIMILDLGHYSQTLQGFLSYGSISVTVDFIWAVILM